MTDAAKVPEDAMPETAGQSTYVVQVLRSLEVVTGRRTKGDGEMDSKTEAITEKHDAWVDLATITLPPKSHRKQAIRLALAEAGIKPDPKAPPLRVRVLDVDSAREVPVPVVVSDPTFAI